MIYILDLAVFAAAIKRFMVSCVNCRQSVTRTDANCHCYVFARRTCVSVCLSNTCDWAAVDLVDGTKMVFAGRRSTVRQQI